MTVTPLDDAPEVCRLTAETLTALYAAGELSPVEVVDAVLGRIDTITARFNGFRYVDAEGAQAAARASERRWRCGTPLGAADGVPTTIKDIIWVRDWVARYGSLTTPDTPAVSDAPAVAHLRAAGAVLVGMTTVPEFGWKAVTDSALDGITRNPWDPTRTPGGSSGGAAVAAATGAGTLHLGTDGGGSIRVPAAFTGTVGLKPSFGRVPAFPMSSFGSVAHLGPMGRSVADVARMLRVMARPDPRDAYQSFAPEVVADEMVGDLRDARIGIWATPPFGAVEPDVADGFGRALAVLEDLGAELVEISLPQENLHDVFRTLWSAGAAQRLRGMAPESRALIDPGLQAIARVGGLLTLDDLADASTARAAFTAAVERLFDTDVDLIVSPSTAVSAFAAGQEVPADRGLERWTEWAGFSYPMNLTQQPALSVPAGLTPDGLPLGLQIIGAKGADLDVLGAGLAFEIATAGGSRLQPAERTA
ncbi:MAG: amidase [Pseudomonadota bacterium]